jgi:hypothetical protein
MLAQLLPGVGEVMKGQLAINNEDYESGALRLDAHLSCPFLGLAFDF